MIPTVAVTVTAHDQNGNPVAGGRVTAQLNRAEVYQGFVAPERVTGVMDAAGVCVLQLWPNALGVNGSSYLISAWNPDTGQEYLCTTAVVPNSDCRLEQIIVAKPYPPLDASAQALAAAQAALGLATEQAQIATNHAIQTGVDKTQTGLDRVQTGLDRGNTALDRVQTGLDRTATTQDRGQTALDRTQTGLDRAATGEDRVATGEDRAQTVLDRAAATQDALDAAASAITASEQAVLATTQAGITTTKAETATTQADLAAIAAQNAQLSANNTSAAVLSNLQAVRSQTEIARDQALAGLGSANNSQTLSTLLGTLAYALDIACEWEYAIGINTAGIADSIGVVGSTPRAELFTHMFAELFGKVGVVSRAVSGGGVLLSPGVQTPPPLSPLGDPGSGVMFPAVGQIAFVTDFLERLRVDASGRLGIGTAAPSGLLDVADNKLRIRTAQTPASASASGNQGEIAWDANFFYVCTATNVWRRSALVSW